MMAGKLCMGTKDVPKDPAISKAYCEGRHANRIGIAYEDNPHGIADSEAWEAWRVGYVSWVNPPNLGGPDCCADPFGGGYA